MSIIILHVASYTSLRVNVDINNLSAMNILSYIFILCLYFCHLEAINSNVCRNPLGLIYSVTVIIRQLENNKATILSNNNNYMVSLKLWPIDDKNEIIIGLCEYIERSFVSLGNTNIRLQERIFSIRHDDIAKKTKKLEIR